MEFNTNDPKCVGNTTYMHYTYLFRLIGNQNDTTKSCLVLAS